MPVTLPRDILERVERVHEYHQASKHTYESVRAELEVLDAANRPSPYRVFADHPKTPLPTTILDIPAPALGVLRGGDDALPESQICPPQDLKTLATWLHMAAGLTQKTETDGVTAWLRSCPSAGALYPCEIYIAAFGLHDLEPGLYHYSPREFALRKLREGWETFSQMKRGRPELEFLKTVPAVLLVSTIFWRSAWKYQKRAYRYALEDAGHLIQNLVTVGTGLGVQTMTRLRVNDSTWRELIGGDGRSTLWGGRGGAGRGDLG